MTDLDPRLTFDAFVVGPANRLAHAAAKRAADAPGTSYNPLFLYSASGLGKSHILAAIAHHATRQQARVTYQTLEGYLAELTKTLGSGTRDSMKERYKDIDILLLDDVQFLTGQPEAQEMLLQTLDALSMAGRQIVLASDRPPAEINGLDARLVSRFSGGLMVDIGAPEYETRVAIIRKKVEDRGARLQPGVPEALARVPFKNVRELQGALNRVLAIQDLEQRHVSAKEIPDLFAQRVRDAQSGAAVPAEAEPAPVPEAPPADEPTWSSLLQEVIQRAESWGFVATRLRRILEDGQPPDDLPAIVEAFQADIERLRHVAAELDRVGNPWPEAATAVLRNPERLEEAESLLLSARERMRPFAPIPEGPKLEELVETSSSMAVRAAERLVVTERPDYNPLFLACSNEEEGLAVMEAAGRTFRRLRPEGRVALISSQDFADDFIRALSDGVAGAWRERWWTVELLLLHGTQALSETERAQDELFHLFEALKRRGARILLAADRTPAAIEGIDDRLRSRFEGGLVVEIEEGSVGPRVHRAAEAVQGWTRPDAVAGLDLSAVDIEVPLEEFDWGDLRGATFLAAAKGRGSPSSPTRPASMPILDSPLASPGTGGIASTPSSTATPSPLGAPGPASEAAPVASPTPTPASDEEPAAAPFAAASEATPANGEVRWEALRDGVPRQEPTRSVPEMAHGAPSAPPAAATTPIGAGGEAKAEGSGAPPAPTVRTADRVTPSDPIDEATVVASPGGDWFPTPEEVVWDWPDVEDRVVEEAD